MRRRRDGLAGGARGVALGDLDVVEQVDVVAAAWHVVDRHRVVRVPPDGGDVRGDVGAVAAERQHLQLVRLWLVGVGGEAAAKGFLAREGRRREREEAWRATRGATRLGAQRSVVEFLDF